ncbi:hypothetical protein [Endozoicomonas ascidiicola]|uniref:hypothetical protein n=1 Tax=Endozoicomonas ascidiicola TaxID=1698521 RepID=UPI0008363B63|nr:hypothetical protein [Endozoicomonas ascidiicola]
MAGIKSLGGILSPLAENKHKYSKKTKATKHNHRKVERAHCKNQVIKNNAEPSKPKEKALKSRKAGVLDRLFVTFMKPDRKSSQLDLDKVPKSISSVAKRGEKAKTAEEARGAIKDYFELLKQSYSKEAPPSPEVREQLYGDVVKLSAKVMSFSLAVDHYDDKEEKLGLTAELLQQMQTALDASSADFVNSQVTAVLSLGMMTQDDKDFLFASCLNTQIISVDKYTDGIKSLDERVYDLKMRLRSAKEEDSTLQGKINNAEQERADLERASDQLVSQEKEGMHGQKDFFKSCYEIILDQVRSEIRTGLKKQLKKKNADAGTELVKNIMEKINLTLNGKSESIAKNTANLKKGVQAGKVYQEKREGIKSILDDEVSRLLGEGKKGTSDLKSIPAYKNDSPMPAYKIDDKTSGIDLPSVKLHIDDDFLPMNKQAEEWVKTLLEKLPDSTRMSVDVEDLTRRLTEKALEMDIVNGLILPEGSKSPFDRNSVSRKVIRKKKGPEAIKPSTSVTEALKEAVVKQEQKIKALAANKQISADIKQKNVVQELTLFFEGIIEQHRIDARKGFAGRSSTRL